MAQTNYTPIQLYHSTTGAAAPTSGNLVNGELAINITDGKLFYKDNLGAVQVLATKAGASGNVVGPASSTDNALVRFDATTGKLVQNSVGLLSDTGDLTGLNSITLITPLGVASGGTGSSSTTFVNLATNVTGTLPVASGGTGAATLTANNVLLGNGTSAVQVVAPGTAGNVLMSNGTTWSSATPTPSSQVYPGAGMAVSTGTAWAASKTTPTGDVVGTSDTQTLTNKTLTAPVITTPVITQNVQVISTSTTAVASRTYVLTASLTLTLPASPSAGDWVAFSNRSGTLTSVIARNGSNIMGLAEDMTVDSLTAGFTLTFADATRGWVLAP
jgi:hypothetical protein